MYSVVYQVEAPAQEPVSLCLARQHRRIDFVDDDDLLSAYITAARMLAENYLNRALITQTLQYVGASTPPNQSGWPLLPLSPAVVIMPQWFSGALFGPRPIILPRAPLQSVTSVSTGQWGDADSSLTLGTDYQVDSEMQPGRVRMLSQPSLCRDHISITYVAGYGDTPASVPQPIIVGILWLIAWLYENRGDVPAEMPKAAEMIMTPYRLVTFGG